MRLKQRLLRWLLPRSGSFYGPPIADKIGTWGFFGGSKAYWTIRRYAVTNWLYEDVLACVQSELKDRRKLLTEQEAAVQSLRLDVEFLTALEETCRTITGGLGI